MKLDNIIYDVNSLAKAIAEQWNTESEAFKAIYPSDTATALVNGMAGYGAMMQYLITAALANCYTETAFSEKAIYQLAQTLGNELHGNVSAQVQVDITKLNLIGTATNIPKETVFEINGKKFFNPSGIILPADVEIVRDITLIQGEKITVNKVTNGIPNEKFYFSSDFLANHNYIEVYVNGEQWNVEESFLPYDKNYIIDSSDMNTVVLKTDPDGRTYIKVGDNQLAAMPSSGSHIQIKYIQNDGADGNIGEINATGSLLTPLMYTDRNGNQEQLDVEITTKTTAYGGFGKQSLDVLRQTSPYIFASGHRAIRRQDYNAILQNKCGYITSAVWGEYEEAAKVGAYDSIMLNTVYYTGVKTFQEYPFFEVGYLNNNVDFNSALYSRKGFLGSFSIQLRNDIDDSVTPITFQDNGGKGILFINDNEIDKRDSLLPDWIASDNSYYEAYLPNNYLTGDDINRGTNYSANDVLGIEGTEIYENSEVVGYEVTVRVKEINAQGEVVSLQLVKKTCSKELQSNIPYTVSYLPGIAGNGRNLVFKLAFTSKYHSNLIRTNKAVSYQLENLRSDYGDDSYFRTDDKEVSLLNPLQIFIDYRDDNGNAIQKAIAGVKFRAAVESAGYFPATFAMFGTNVEGATEDNIRNSNEWDKLIERKELIRPKASHNNQWTDWIPTTTFNLKQDNEGNPDFNKYSRYVLEFYSLEEENDSQIADEDGSKQLALSKMKLLYAEDASVIYYDDNGKFVLNLPTIGSPGPDVKEKNATGKQELYDEAGYLTHSTINTKNYALYQYTPTIENLTYSNGYRNGNILAYKFVNSVDNNEVVFSTRVVNIDNGTFSTSVNGSEILSGSEYILTQNKMSLDEVGVYNVELLPINSDNGIVNAGVNYKQNDKIILLDNGEPTDIEFRVTNVNGYSQVLGLVPLSSSSVGKELSGVYETRRTYTPTTGKEARGLKVRVQSRLSSGYYRQLTDTITQAYIRSSGTQFGADWLSASDGGSALTPTSGVIYLILSSGEYDCKKYRWNGTSYIEAEVIINGNKVEENVPGSGATILVTSSDNIKILGRFAGNKIDSDDVTYLDQPIMDKYNHFTTHLEFKQPEITQVDIDVVVRLVKNAPISSGIILQNVRNNIQNLFTVTSDYVGKSLNLSDIYKAITDTEYVEWCKVINPTDNVDVPVNGILMSSSITITEDVEIYG